MANALQGTATFHYPEGGDGKDYRLTLNNRVLLEAEDVLGYSALDAAEQAKAAMDQGLNPMLRTVIALFYGALVQNHREVSEDDAIDMFMGDNPAPKDAFRAVLTGTDAPAVASGNAGNGKAAKPQTSRGTGTASSKAGGKRASGRKSSS